MARNGAKPHNGHLVAIALLSICALGCLATFWNYSHTTLSTNNAWIESDGSTTWVIARFSSSPVLTPGLHATITIESEPSRKRTGIIASSSYDGTARIKLDDAPPPSQDSRASVTIDLTLPTTIP